MRTGATNLQVICQQIPIFTPVISQMSLIQINKDFQICYFDIFYITLLYTFQKKTRTNLSKLFVPVDVHDDDDLDEGNEGETGGSVGVDEGQPIFSGLRCEQNSDEEAK